MTKAVPPQPPPVQWTGHSVLAFVAVSLGADGSVRSTSVVRSSDQRFDLSVLAAAKASKYSPAIFRCNPVPGTYIMRFDFTNPNG
jgi:TonB family protein